VALHKPTRLGDQNHNDDDAVLPTLKDRRVVGGVEHDQVASSERLSFLEAWEKPGVEPVDGGGRAMNRGSRLQSKNKRLGGTPPLSNPKARAREGIGSELG
jgi:hypothetical protein